MNSVSCENCGKPPKFQCPDCLPDPKKGFFCSQECFRSLWPEHRKQHHRAPRKVSKVIKPTDSQNVELRTSPIGLKNHDAEEDVEGKMKDAGLKNAFSNEGKYFLTISGDYNSKRCLTYTPTTSSNELGSRLEGFDYESAARNSLSKPWEGMCVKFEEATGILLLWALHAAFISQKHLSRCLLHCRAILNKSSFKTHSEHDLLHIAILSYLCRHLEETTTDDLSELFGVPHIITLPHSWTIPSPFEARYGSQCGEFLQIFCHTIAHALSSPLPLSVVEHRSGWSPFHLNALWGSFPQLLHRSGYFTVTSTAQKPATTTSKANNPTAKLLHLKKQYHKATADGITTLSMPRRAEAHERKEAYRSMALDELLGHLPASPGRSLPLGTLGDRLDMPWGQFNLRYDGLLTTSLKSFLQAYPSHFCVVQDRVSRVQKPRAPPAPPVRKRKRESEKRKEDMERLVTTKTSLHTKFRMKKKIKRKIENQRRFNQNKRRTVAPEARVPGYKPARVSKLKGRGKKQNMRNFKR